MSRRQREKKDDWVEMREEIHDSEESMGKRIGRFFTMMGLVFAVSGGVVVTQRLSDDSLALLLGLGCGIAAMLPTVLLGVLWIKREMGKREPEPQAVKQSQTQGQPQVIVVAPQALPGFGQGYGQTGPVIPAQWQPAPAAREFKIVGGAD